MKLTVRIALISVGISTALAVNLGAQPGRNTEVAGQPAAEFLRKRLLDGSDAKPTSLQALQLEFGLKSPLRELFYEVGLFKGPENPEFKKSVSEFQTSIGEPATGVLTIGQWSKAVDLAAKVVQAFNAPSFPQGSGEQVQGSADWPFVNTAGTLVIEGERIAWPFNLVTGRAYRSTNTYEETFTYIDNGNAVFSNKDTYDIISWDKDEVVAKKAFGERIQKVVINFGAKSVTYLTDSTSNAGSGSALEPLKKTRVSRLVPSLDAVYEIQRAQKKTLAPFVAREARALFDQ